MRGNSLALALVTFMPFLQACSASLVSSSDQLGGLQSGPRSGVVKYLNEGAPSVVEARIADARKIMAETCSTSNYRVVNTSEKDAYSFAIEDGSGFGVSSEYVYVRFECVESPTVGLLR